MQQIFKNIWSFTKEMIQEYNEDDCFTLGAALSYYTVFSIAPIIIIIIAAAGFTFGQEAIRGEVYDQLSGLLGPDVAAQIQNLVKNAYQSNAGVVATVIGAVTLIFGATGVVNQLKKSLNKIWEMKATPKNGLLQFALDRIMSLAMILAIGFILLVALVIEGVVAALSDKIDQLLPSMSGPLLVGINFVISLILTSLLFSLIFKYLPDARVAWRDAVTGGIFTALLFALGRFGIGLYMAKSNVGETFGAAGFLVILLVWVYYSSQILFLGAEFTSVYARRYGSKILPSANSVKVRRTEVEVNS